MFLRPKIKQTPAAETPAVVASPTETLNSLARIRRRSGGRNSFAASSGTSNLSNGGTAPNTLTGVNG